MQPGQRRKEKLEVLPHVRCFCLSTSYFYRGYQTPPSIILLLTGSPCVEPLHPCLFWKPLAQGLYCYPSFSDLGSLYVLDYSSLIKEVVTENASPELGPISKPISRVIKNLNPNSIHFIGDSFGALVILKLLLFAGLCKKTESIVFIHPFLPPQLQRKFQNQRFTQKIIQISNLENAMLTRLFSNSRFIQSNKEELLFPPFQQTNENSQTIQSTLQIEKKEEGEEKEEEENQEDEEDEDEQEKNEEQSNNEDEQTLNHKTNFQHLNTTLQNFYKELLSLNEESFLKKDEENELHFTEILFKADRFTKQTKMETRSIDF
jgi:hypothetical protein